MPTKTENTVLTVTEVDTILCVFDELLCYVMAKDSSAPDTCVTRYWRLAHDTQGTPGLRSLAVELGRHIERAWLALTQAERDAYDEPFDFEFVPAMLSGALYPPETVPAARWCDPLPMNAEQWEMLARSIATRVSVAEISNAQISDMKDEIKTMRGECLALLREMRDFRADIKTGSRPSSSHILYTLRQAVTRYRTEMRKARARLVELQTNYWSAVE